MLVRKFLTVTALAAFVTGSAFLSAGTASAATTLAGTCSGSVNGNMGDSVAVQGTSVKELVRKGAQDYVNTHLWTLATVWPNSIADTIAGKGALTVGQVPNAAGGTIAGSAIGSTVATALKGADHLGLIEGTKTEVLNAISANVAKGCGLTTIATNYVAPGQPGTGGTGTTPGGTGTVPGGSTGNLSNLNPGTTGGTGGSAPMRDYGGIPTATAGTAVAPGARYPANGTLPGDASAPQAGQGDQSGQGVDIRDAGNAQSLASNSAGSDVQLPMLLAVIILAGVTAGLVRTWVLRRAS
ncbi:hypothetical protein M8542_42465 [Amycolatopsis sp. OK19-0408]|uniref:Uncharacterized protein n=1 Tax=Amycolatopsis iheyensis TaxID=2945988 RepID=A0A9X2SNY3_9PSEU|nr:hypothetical protein [Amycolatopsis iheyensis]MCR6489502.1 hypothetical protein [Amycolatopsis iheyensis]